MISSLLFILTCSNIYADDKLNKIEPHGFTLHMGPFFDEVKSNLGNYPINGSNWKFRDNNSLFIHIIGDELYDNEKLFPGYNLDQLDKETNKNNILYWKPSDSLMWISAKDFNTLNEYLKSDVKLQSLIKELAYNQYQIGSYANITGSTTKVEFNDYKESPYYELDKKYTPPEYNENYAGIYNLNKINYDKPDLYLKHGYQSKMKNDYINELKSEVGISDNSMKSLIKIMNYYHDNFDSAGLDDYRLSANNIFEMKKISGCTEQSLIITSILRSLGFPSVLAATVSLEAAKETKPPNSINSGHYMTEVYVEGKWILLDGNGRIGINYNPLNPYILRKFENNIDEGFVFGKGLDNWDFGLYYEDAYRDMCIEFINRLNTIDKYTQKKEITIMQKY